ncbi:PREDICTED: uncharacterized protein LOC106811640 [Priapulus caudatus]|uniref:Uncharacterized protein LOC106811640 n=1 Tax=Priapulus caudatus TaxID=37621 RepID=A0ABM1EF57_PRICU|nr:PREDICTED: uncharacterized protein LOC106811640 [Priapulus caudatus]
MWRVDPAGVALRSQKAIKRRTYAVEAPNSLWHLDGNHKLIRWRIVIHGAVDGYSRLITFMKASTNNRATTVQTNFKEAVDQYGIPSRIRCDYGGENQLVRSFMEENRGTGRGSAICGKSVHNQRIERLWRDLWDGATNTYYDLFTAFERDNLLNPNSEEQLYALHYIFLPRIQHAIDTFVKQWNHHKLRTENMSPVQLFVEGSLQLYNSANTATRGIFAGNHPSSSAENTSDAESLPDTIHARDNSSDSDRVSELDIAVVIVTIPDTVGLLSENALDTLKEHIDPLSNIEAADMGLSHYLGVLDFISENMNL